MGGYMMDRVDELDVCRERLVDPRTEGTSTGPSSL